MAKPQRQSMAKCINIFIPFHYSNNLFNFFSCENNNSIKLAMRSEKIWGVKGKLYTHLECRYSNWIWGIYYSQWIYKWFSNDEIAQFIYRWLNISLNVSKELIYFRLNKKLNYLFTCWLSFILLCPKFDSNFCCSTETKLLHWSFNIEIQHLFLIIGQSQFFLASILCASEIINRTKV